MWSQNELQVHNGAFPQRAKATLCNTIKDKKDVGGLEIKYLAWPAKVKVLVNKNYLKTQNNESVFILSES